MRPFLNGFQNSFMNKGAALPPDDTRHHDTDHIDVPKITKVTERFQRDEGGQWIE